MSDQLTLTALEKITDTVFRQLISFDADGIDPGYGAVSSPVEQPDGSYTIRLKDQATLTKTVAIITIHAPLAVLNGTGE